MSENVLECQVMSTWSCSSLSPASTVSITIMLCWLNLVVVVVVFKMVVNVLPKRQI